jgi:hypothetical protein
MEDFRTQLTEIIDAMRLGGVDPVFLVVDLEGAGSLKGVQSEESLEKFRAAAVGAVTAAGQGCDAFTYGEDRVVAILPGYDRLKTFAVIEKLRRALPLLGQSFDLFVRPDFDVLEYDSVHGVAGLINSLVTASKEKFIA